MTNWFKKAYPSINSYFVVIDPSTYYEWEHTGFVPKNTKLSYGNIRKAKSLDKTIISINCEDTMINSSEKGFSLSANLPVSNLKFISGNPKSKDEIANEYKQLCNKFSQNLNLFKQHILNKTFVFKEENTGPSLIIVKAKQNENPQLDDYGSWKEIVTKLAETQKILNAAGRNPIYKARDLSVPCKLNSIMAKLKRASDITSIEIVSVIDVLKLKPKMSYGSTWEELYENCDLIASKFKKRIEAMRSLQWLDKLIKKSSVVPP